MKTKIDNFSKNTLIYLLYQGDFNLVIGLLLKILITVYGKIKKWLLIAKLKCFFI